MKAWLRGFYYSLPVQLVFLHFRRYQVLLVFWFVLFSTTGGIFMKNFGADSLFLAPEYLGDVNAAGFAIVGVAIGMFIMSWNVTTFILFSRYVKFLATTTNPFLRYCVNNSVIPVIFLVFYFARAWEFDHYKELIRTADIAFLFGGFVIGLSLMFAVSVFYFFGADKTILRRMVPVMTGGRQSPAPGMDEPLLRIDWYLETPRTVKKTRNVAHYTQEFIDTLFKRHHFAAVIAIFIAFAMLLIVGFFLENRFFQIPAAASITILFAILIGVSGAFSYFLQSWSVPYLLILLLVLNMFYKLEWIDPRNKAYGLNYSNKNERPEYSRQALLQLCN
ncbi:MAG TPA: hypothetical protein VGC95_04950, partial [Chitinophagaceae bacterium]